MGVDAIAANAEAARAANAANASDASNDNAANAANAANVNAMREETRESAVAAGRREVTRMCAHVLVDASLHRLSSRP